MVGELAPATEAVASESVGAGGSEDARELAGPLVMSALVGHARLKGCGCNLFVRIVSFLHGSEGMVQLWGWPLFNGRDSVTQSMAWCKQSDAGGPCFS